MKSIFVIVFFFSEIHSPRGCPRPTGPKKTNVCHIVSSSVSSKKCLTCPQSVITAMIPMAMTLFKKLHFQIIDFVEAFHTQYHTILVTEFLPGEMVMVMVVKGVVNGEW